MKKRNQNPSFDSPTIDQLAKVSYQDLHQGTDGFSDKNLIGSGSFGCVYSGNLVSEVNVVAVKVLNLQKNGASKSFIVECNALKNIRHRNSVKVLTCCSSTNYKGQEFKALVFYYMKNGSLEQWLHPEILNSEHPKTLDLGHRLNIIIDVASALHYLHQECEQLIIHCDLKPSNVLLNDDMVAHVSDFGIATFVSTIGGTSQPLATLLQVLRMPVIYLLILNPSFTILSSPSLSPNDFSSEMLKMLSLKDIKGMVAKGICITRSRSFIQPDVSNCSVVYPLRCKTN
ncbi:putative protein kinase RLK-Pelle-LRR-XII-1 family [Medicago truncatula]|nr:probable LRR receptor-like serine/threonine-protein kinase At3g47570 [Medicago truncatula]RHN54523.1 putative protein kinase RLK-Pelle-LRR-XII-1 family [Medicago truncatula]